MRYAHTSLLVVKIDSQMKLVTLCAIAVTSAFAACFQQKADLFKIIVLAEHEKNFDTLMQWLEASRFASKTNFILSVRETFNAAKAGDSAKYTAWLKTFDSELAKLDSVEMKELMNFALTSLSPVKSEEMVSTEVPGCKADCLLTSCTITCPSRTKPKCQCHFFFADCGCELYNR